MPYRPVESHEEYLKILENYKDYKKNTYKSMTLEEKIDFFDGIHTDHVPMFDENGNDTLKVIRSIIRFYGKSGAVFFLAHLSNVPEQGKQYGLCDSLRYLITDDITYPYLKEAVMSADSYVQGFLFKILNGEIVGVYSPLKYAKGVEADRIKELKAMMLK